MYSLISPLIQAAVRKKNNTIETAINSLFGNTRDETDNDTAEDKPTLL